MRAIIVEALAKRIGEVTAVVDVSFEVRERSLANSYLTLVSARMREGADHVEENSPLAGARQGGTEATLADAS
jgi:hypothetical protein